MAAEDRERWNARHRAGDHGSASPSRVFTDLEPLLPPPGRALDVGGGAGRHAIWLAQRGWDSTITDISSVALEIAQQRAHAAGVKVQAVERDLDTEGLPPGPWQLIVCFHFLWRPLLALIPKELAIGGRLVIVQPTLRNLERHPRPPERYLLREGELAELVRELAIVHYVECWSIEGRHEAVLVAQR